MYEMDKAAFGAFLAGLRKQKGMTQKELASRLFVSDKAVSKWERGLSIPDVTLLEPLAEQLEVTVTELLRARRMEKEEPMAPQEVEGLVHSTIHLSAGMRARDRRWQFIYVFGLLLAAVELGLLLRAGRSIDQMWTENLLVAELLCLLFGGWFCLGAQETLPAYYDQNKISFLSSGVFRMNLPGVLFNNRNWPHILRICRCWMVAVPVVLPAIYWLVPNGMWEQSQLWFLLLPCLGFFIPVVAVGRRYE